MSEPLYNRSKAVAALNHIDGFEPMEFARVIENEGKEPQLYPARQLCGLRPGSEISDC